MYLCSWRWPARPKNLLGELRGLVPQSRALRGDEWQVLIVFDREGWGLALFEHLYEHGFDALTWRKGKSPDLDLGVNGSMRRTPTNQGRTGYYGTG